MISVVHLITSLEPAGAQWMLARLVCAMNPDEFDNRVISMMPGGRVDDYLREHRIRVLSLDMSRGKVKPIDVLHLIRALRRDPPEILQTWLYHADLLGLFAGRITGIRSILWNIRCSEMHKAPRTTRIIRRLLRSASSMPQAIISNSHAAVAAHENFGYSAKRWIVIPNGFDTRRFRPDPSARREMRARLGLTDGNFVVGTMGRPDPIKDFHTFVKAACRFLERKPVDAVFILGGGGIDGLGLAQHVPAEHRQRIRFLGEIEDVPGIMSTFDVFTLTSVAEGFPNVVGEAMACGIPCVVTDVGDSALLVGSTGIVLPPGSPDAIASAWETLFDDVGMRCGMGEAARLRIVEHFSLGAVVEQYQNLYREVAAGQGGI
jgi:glycosyltransferase involved in cell wall biosynthesis